VAKRAEALAAKLDVGQAANSSEPLSYGELGDSLAFHLRLAQEASFNAFARRVGQTDLRPGRYAILKLIAENPGISQTVLSQASGRDKSSLTPALDDLETRGLIRRERVATDRRSYALFLTAPGRTALAALDQQAQAHNATLDRIVGPEEREAFMRLLQRIATTLGDGTD
jgi:DNA-binding MarR family transcriptional regulator